MDLKERALRKILKKLDVLKNKGPILRGMSFPDDQNRRQQSIERFSYYRALADERLAAVSYGDV